MGVLLTSPECLPFTVALGVMLALAVLEGTMTVLGAGLSQLVDAALPDIDVDLAAPDAATPGVATRALAWLQLGRVPAIVVLIVFLTAFGLLGFAVQAGIRAFTGGLAPALAAAPAAALLALPPTRWGARLVGRILPGEETSAVSSESFVGRLATVTVGEARPGYPAEARLADEYGQSHYVLVEPVDDVVCAAGARLLIIERTEGGIYRAVPDPTET
ncbi:YqiJ family protein [Arhodomonas sp. AD133]|uniref:YqiJ family protein n=1 Tax=Arhodomonas sp. AD133 TaxID=3415009 RepID=UPI003EBCCF68